jgi:hypothetical protein
MWHHHQALGQTLQMTAAKAERFQISRKSEKRSCSNRFIHTFELYRLHLSLHNFTYQPQHCPNRRLLLSTGSTMELLVIALIGIATGIFILLMGFSIRQLTEWERRDEQRREERPMTTDRSERSASPPPVPVAISDVEKKLDWAPIDDVIIYKKDVIVHYTHAQKSRVHEIFVDLSIHATTTEARDINLDYGLGGCMLHASQLLYVVLCTLRWLGRVSCLF